VLDWALVRKILVLSWPFGVGTMAASGDREMFIA